MSDVFWFGESMMIEAIWFSGFLLIPGGMELKIMGALRACTYLAIHMQNMQSYINCAETTRLQCCGINERHRLKVSI